MILVDTSVWIEFLRGRQPYFKYLLFLLHHNEVVTIEPIFAELIQGALSKWEVKMIKDYYDSLENTHQEELLVKAAIESSKNKWTSKGIGLVDSTVLMTALQTKTPVWSLDKNLLKELPTSLRHDPNLV